jgi:hypothetical protein
MPSRGDLPRAGTRDRKPGGTLTIIRANYPAFTDGHGAKRSSPARAN